MQGELADAGFEVTAGVAEIPTAFVASWGTGAPVIGILAEFDALPGINQDAVPTRQPIEGKSAGHACGHHLFGTASTHAAIAIKEWMESQGTQGTIRLFGTPAEEGGSGKVYMARAGLFDDVDVVLSWHAADNNYAGPNHEPGGEVRQVSVRRCLRPRGGGARTRSVGSRRRGSDETTWSISCGSMCLSRPASTT